MEKNYIEKLLTDNNFSYDLRVNKFIDGSEICFLLEDFKFIEDKSVETNILFNHLDNGKWYLQIGFHYENDFFSDTTSSEDESDTTLSKDKSDTILNTHELSIDISSYEVYSDHDIIGKPFDNLIDLIEELHRLKSDGSNIKG